MYGFTGAHLGDLVIVRKDPYSIYWILDSANMRDYQVASVYNLDL